MNPFGKKGAIPLPHRLSLSPEEASALTGIGMTSIRQAAANGALKARKLGTRTIILQDDLRDWLKAMPVIGKNAVSETQP
jgi:excisionase family DNA binding protein